MDIDQVPTTHEVVEQPIVFAVPRNALHDVDEAVLGVIDVHKTPRTVGMSEPFLQPRPPTRAPSPHPRKR